MDLGSGAGKQKVSLPEQDKSGTYLAFPAAARDLVGRSRMSDDPKTLPTKTNLLTVEKTARCSAAVVRSSWSTTATTSLFTSLHIESDGHVCFVYCLPDIFGFQVASRGWRQIQSSKHNDLQAFGHLFCTFTKNKHFPPDRIPD